MTAARNSDVSIKILDYIRGGKELGKVLAPFIYEF